MWTTPNSKKNLIKTNMREILNQKKPPKKQICENPETKKKHGKK